MTYPRPENVTFCSQIISAPAAPFWQGSGSGNIMVAMSGFVPQYAEMRSDMLGADAGQVATPAGSQWRMLRGRWPIQTVGTLQLAAWATWVVLEKRQVGGVERKRVYLLDDTPATGAAVASVSVWLWGNSAPAPLLSINPGQSRYRQTQVVGGVEQLSGDLNVPAADDGNFIASLTGYATGKGFNLIA